MSTEPPNLSSIVASPSFDLSEPPAVDEGEDLSSAAMTSSGIFTRNDDDFVDEDVTVDAIDDRLRSVSLTGSIHEMKEEVEQIMTMTTDDLQGPSSSEDDSFDDAKEVLSSAQQSAESKSNSKEGSPVNKNTICNDEWRFRPKHLFILSEAGKPIYSRYGDEDELSSLMAVMQATVSFVQDMGDNIRAIKTDTTTIVFLNKRPLILVAVSNGGCESVTQLIIQLTYLYHQVLSVLTLTQITRIFEQKKGYDLRRMIAGSERLLDSLAASMDDSIDEPSFMLSSVKVVPMSASSRESVSNAIGQHCGKVKNVVFALLMAKDRLITLVRMKKYFIHPADLHLIFNLVNSTESFKLSESWTPICLPKFDPSGFLHAHVSYLSEDSPVCLMMLTVERDIFFELSEARKKIVQSLEKSGAMKMIDDGLAVEDTDPVSIGVPDIKHFLYKSKTTAQFSSSKFALPYSKNAGAKRRLGQIYTILQSRLHAQSKPMKVIYYNGPYENVMTWAQQTFEVYATFDPLIDKTKAIASLNKLLKWFKKEENTLFIHSAPTF